VELDVITAGEPLVLLAAQQAGALDSAASFARVSAGAELNVAIGLARLGLRCGYISRVGNDSFGRFLTNIMVSESVDHSHVAVDSDHRTGFMLKSRSDDGSDPVIEYFRKDSAASHMQAHDLNAAYFAGARHVHLTGIYVGVSHSAREAVFEMASTARRTGKTTSFDPNLRPSLWPSQKTMVDCLNQLACLSDWVLPGLAEGQLLSGRDTPQGIADFYLERGAKAVVIKLGPKGAYYASANETGYVDGVPVLKVVDTVGAGDGFAVGIISALLEGMHLAEACVRANAIGARVVQFPGDCDGLPTRLELDSFLSADHP
jgi:2-dehydro-3-deoxygluconokinase